MSEIPVDQVKAYLLNLQNTICDQLEQDDAGTKAVLGIKTFLYRALIVPVHWVFKLTIPISEPERW